MQGFEQLDTDKVSEPIRHLPDDVTGLKIAIKITGGVGDAVIVIGSVARFLHKLGACVTAVTVAHQTYLMKSLEGVQDVIPVQRFNNLQVQRSFDVILDFASTFNNRRELKQQEYYSLVSDRLGREVSPGRFTFEKPPQGVLKSVAIHPSASNPNRRWTNDKWEELAYELRDRGLSVSFLGTKDEFGFNDQHISKCSDTTEDLRKQAERLSTCEYFIGCDSGFAHIAGVLQVPGLVLFGNTHPLDVIGSYPYLQGVHAFDRLGISPSRSLDQHCEKSQKAMTAIVVSDVLKKIPISQVAVKPLPRNKVNPVRMLMCLVGRVPSNLLSELRPFFQIQVFISLPETAPKFDVILDCNSNRLTTKNGNSGTVRLDSVTTLVRAVRELSNIK